MLPERDSCAIGDTTQSPVDGVAGYTQPISPHARTYDRCGDARDLVLQVVRRRRTSGAGILSELILLQQSADHRLKRVKHRPRQRALMSRRLTRLDQPPHRPPLDPQPPRDPPLRHTVNAIALT